MLSMETIDGVIFHEDGEEERTIYFEDWLKEKYNMSISDLYIEVVENYEYDDDDEGEGAREEYKGKLEEYQDEFYNWCQKYDIDDSEVVID